MAELTTNAELRLEAERLADENAELRRIVAVLADKVPAHEFPTYPDYMEWTHTRPLALGIDLSAEHLI